MAHHSRVGAPVVSGHRSCVSPVPNRSESAAHIAHEVGDGRVERIGDAGEGAEAWVRLPTLNAGEVRKVGCRALCEARAGRTTAIAKLAYAYAGDDGRVAFEVVEHACILARCGRYALGQKCVLWRVGRGHKWGRSGVVFSVGW